MLHVAKQGQAFFIQNGYDVRMARPTDPNRLEAFRQLEDNKFYTATDIANLAPFEGSMADVKQKRRYFYINLNSHYAGQLGEPDEMMPREGSKYVTSPAWLGKKWKSLVDLDT